MPHILEKQVVGHMTEGIEEEASKSQCRGVGGSVGTWAWGTGGRRKEKDVSRGAVRLYIARLY